MLMSMKRTGSNHLLYTLSSITKKKFVWFDALKEKWNKFNLTFEREIWNENVKWCLNELYTKYDGCKINWDEEGFFNIIDDLIQYDVKKILLYRKNIWEKVISEELAIQTNHWTASIGYHRRFKSDYKFEELNLQTVKDKMIKAQKQIDYVMDRLDDNMLVYTYEDLFSKERYTDQHKKNFLNLLVDLNISYNKDDLDNLLECMKPELCYKTNQSYENIANISELEKLKNYLYV